MILVTGSTGGLGKEVISAMTKLAGPQQLAALARDLQKADWLIQAGISVRKGDYADYKSLLKAFSGIEKLLMISAPAFSDPILEANTVRAAKDAGVKNIVYTGVQRRENSGWIIPGVTERDAQIEKLLKASGMSYTIVHNALYLDSIPFLLGSQVMEHGVLFPSQNGHTAAVSRADLGEALARIMLSEKLYPNHITLSNSKNWSKKEMAEVLSAISGKNVQTIEASVSEYITYQKQCGIPEFYARFAADWAEAISAEEMQQTDPLLENILGRKPVGLPQFFKTFYQN